MQSQSVVGVVQQSYSLPFFIFFFFYMSVTGLRGFICVFCLVSFLAMQMKSDSVKFAIV